MTGTSTSVRSETAGRSCGYSQWPATWSSGPFRQDPLGRCPGQGPRRLRGRDETLRLDSSSFHHRFHCTVVAVGEMGYWLCWTRSEPGVEEEDQVSLSTSHRADSETCVGREGQEDCSSVILFDLDDMADQLLVCHCPLLPPCPRADWPAAHIGPVAQKHSTLSDPSHFSPS